MEKENFWGELKVIQNDWNVGVKGRSQSWRKIKGVIVEICILQSRHCLYYCFYMEHYCWEHSMLRCAL
jgi:hypothetical protein